MATGKESIFLDYFPKIILFGDSLTQFSFGPGGFGAAVSNHFQRKCDVLNRGFSGYTTRSCKLILPKLLQNDDNPSGSIAAAVTLLGTNDAENVNAKNSRHVPAEEYKQNLKTICHQFYDAGVPFDRQILITPPPVVEHKWTEYCKMKGCDMTFGDEFASHKAKACLETGKELGIEVFDLRSEALKTDNWELLLNDGVHFSEKGNSLVSKALIPLLEKRLSHLITVYPDWEDIHPKEPEKTLLK